ncbi:MAG: chloride channel protein [Atopobiaceae bacterium]|nr:chloride channel protein [Atopobiaceae bacterium]MBR3313015.1 chloride channel protein [Atopobiaceae bacterium]
MTKTQRRSAGKPKPKARDARPYVADARRVERAAEGIFGTRMAMVLLALIVGFAIGFVVFLLMNLSGWLTKLLWEGVGEHLSIPAFSLICCTAGGVVIGLWTKLSGNSIDSLETVMAQFKKTGSYRLENPPATAVSFLLPLVFGGSIGFEAGLTGIIAAGCCWVRDRLKIAGLRVAGIADVTIAASLSAIFATPLAGLVAGFESENDDALRTELGHVDDYNLRHEAKLVLYLAAAVGSFAGIAAFTRLFGGSGGFPRFEAIEAHGPELLWGLLALVAAYALLLVFRGAEKGAELLSHRLATQPYGIVAQPIIAGVLLGAIALVLPLVLFPGEEQSHELMETWSSIPAALLLATGVVKAIATPFCIELGWKGGDLFPCIFAGIATGYGLAALTGADAMLMVTVTTTAFLAGVTQKPLLALGILALCFPMRGILYMGLAALVGATLPIPATLAKK